MTAFKHREQEEAIGWETDHTGQSAPAEGQLWGGGDGSRQWYWDNKFVLFMYTSIQCTLVFDKWAFR